MLFAPKCHPELQYPIESSWAKMKGHLRRNCRHTLISLRENIISGLQPENFPLTLVQKWFRKMRDYMAAYEAGADRWQDRGQGGQAAQEAPRDLRQNAGRRVVHIGGHQASAA